MVFSTLFAIFAVTGTALAVPRPRATCSGGRVANDARCCKFFDVLDDMQANLFENQCAENAHQSLRISFHDAVGRSVLKGPNGGGGADGSILTFPIELQLSENLSVNGIADKLRPFGARHNLSDGDLIHFAAAVGVSNCAGAPRLQFHANRPRASVAAPELSVPRGNDLADSMIPRLTDAGFSLEEFVALMASHTMAAQSGIDGTVQGAPFDSTPDLFDTQFFIESSLKGTITPGVPGTRAEDLSPIPGEFRIQSDGSLARDPRTVCFWQSYVDQPAKMVQDFATAFGKMAVNGLNPNGLIDCSDIVPIPKSLVQRPHFPAGKSLSDVDAVCRTKAFPSLRTDPGAQTEVAAVPPQPVRNA